MKPALYLESTIPSYLTAHPSRDLIVAAHQQITHEWWQHARTRFSLFVSEAVLEAIAGGDPSAAARRRALVAGIPVLELTQEVTERAAEYRTGLSLPPRAQLDAVYIAFAVTYDVDYLLTWNCTHLANGVLIRRLYELNLSLGRKTPVIATPEELLKRPEGEQDVE
ncbi:MAG: type II toxin-antitoxin system VapC family toxin [Spirochaetaceae bacterium]|nr:type II toxin-antitoxin system VapC family toxin [Spirochaetaceae bacterium]